MASMLRALQARLVASQRSAAAANLQVCLVQRHHHQCGVDVRSSCNNNNYGATHTTADHTIAAAGDRADISYPATREAQP